LFFANEPFAVFPGREECQGESGNFWQAWRETEDDFPAGRSQYTFFLVKIAPARTVVTESLVRVPEKQFHETKLDCLEVVSFALACVVLRSRCRRP
jgi:hypothetical protein